VKQWLMAALLLAAGCGSKDEPATPVVKPAPQTTIQAAVVEIKTSQAPIRVEVTGQVMPIFQAVLSSRIQGTIDKLLVREGTLVVKGRRSLSWTTATCGRSCPAPQRKSRMPRRTSTA